MTTCPWCLGEGSHSVPDAWGSAEWGGERVEVCERCDGIGEVEDDERVESEAA